MRLLATLLVLALPLVLATPVPQSFVGEPTRDVIVSPKGPPKPQKDRCEYGYYICDLGLKQKMCSKKYIEYMTEWVSLVGSLMNILELLALTME